MTITVTGFSPDDAVPDAYINSVFGGGLVALSSIPVKVVCLGNKIATGVAVADTDVIPITSEDESDWQLGATSECGEMCCAAIAAGGASVWAAPIAEASAGPVAASITVTFTIASAIQRNGTLKFRIGGRSFSVGVATTDAVGSIASNTVLAGNAVVRRRYLASAALGVTTFTLTNVGARGNQTLLYCDASDVPGLTVTVAGGTAIHTGTRTLTPFSAGAGTDSVANQLANLTSDTYDYIACAANDTTNIGLVKTHVTNESIAGTSHLEHAVFAIFGTYAAAQSLATSTMNDARLTLLWSTYLENTPAWYTGYVAARRASVVAQQPNFKWGGTDQCKLTGAQAHDWKADNPNHATKKNALNNGLCVLGSNGADVVIIRGIVTKCLSSSNPDFRTRDWGEPDTTDAVNKRVRYLWLEVSAANHYAVPDDPTGKQPNPGEITPSSWNAQLYQLMLELQGNNWVYLVAEHPPVSEWDNGRKCIMSAVPTYVKPKTYQFGANVNQMVA